MKLISTQPVRKLLTTFPAHLHPRSIHALRVFGHCLLGGGAPRPAGCWTDFDDHVAENERTRFTSAGSTRSRTSPST